MAYERRWESDGGIYTRFYGFLSKEELLRQAQELQADPKVQQLQYVISDFCDLEGHNVSDYDVLFLAAKDFQLPIHYLAIVTASEDVRHLAERYMRSPLMKSVREMCIVENLSDARTWISERLASKNAE